MVGFIIFWTIYLWGSNKKRLFWAIILCSFIAVMASHKIQTIFWQVGQHEQTAQLNLNAASSGRFFIWSHNIQIFLNSSIPQQLIGRGLGCESRKVISAEDNVWPPHNNYLNLLMSLGVIGLFIYLTLLAVLLWDIYRCELDKSTKCFFGGIVISVIAMNFLSNAVIFRIELSQYFWLFMAFFYFTKERAETGQVSIREPEKYRSPA